MARSFNGGTDQVDLGNSASLAPATITTSLWLKPSGSQTDTYGSVFIKRDAAPNAIFSTLFRKDVNKLAYYFNSNVSFVDPGSTVLTNGTWYNVVCTYDPVGGLQTYVGAVSDGTAAFTGALSGDSAHSTIIGNDTDLNFRFSGNISDVAIWNTVLSSGEISALANGARPPTIRQGSLIGYWPLDGLQSPEPDLSGNARNGTLTGTAFSFGPPLSLFSPRVVSFPLAGPLPFGPGVTTTLTNVPARAFTKKHYYNELEKARRDSMAAKAILAAMDDRGRADHDFELAQAIADNFDKNMTPTNYAKAMDAKERLEKARKARDHHYFMDVVKKAWADHEAQKKK